MPDLCVCLICQVSNAPCGFYRSVQSDGMSIVNIDLSSEHGENIQMFDQFCAKVQQVEKEKGVILVLSDESAASIDREGSGAALCISYLIKVKGLPLETALTALKAKRPELKPSSSLTMDLHDYQLHCRYAHSCNSFPKLDNYWLHRNRLSALFSSLAFGTKTSSFVFMNNGYSESSI